MIETQQQWVNLGDEQDSLRRRVQELEDLELQRVLEEQERFDALQVLDEYAKQLEESRDKIARLFKAAANVQEAKTLQEALQKIADAVCEAGWGSVSVGLYDNFEIVQAAYAGCTAADIEFLETHRRPAAERARMYGPDFERFQVSRSYFVPADHLTEVMSLDNVCPGRREIQPGDDWDPMDLTYVPLYGMGDQIIGCINCDDPIDGRRPTREVFFYLELFAELVSHKVETDRLTEQQRRTEEALRQSEERYRTVFSRSGDGFFLMDYLFLDCNDKACELFGATREQIIGHSPVEFSPKFQSDGRSSLEAAGDYIRQAMSGEPQAFLWTHRRADGTLLDCEVSLAAINISTGNVVFAVVRDVTERRRAEAALRESEERFRKVFEESPIGVTVCATDGRYLHMNQAFCRIVGYAPEELIGRPFAEITHPDDLAGNFQHLHELVTDVKDTVQLEKRYVHKRGHTVWCNITIATLRDDAARGTYFVVQVEDITERKRAELERETIVRILQIANDVAQPDEMVDRIFSEVGRLVPAENRFLALYDPGSETISFPYFVDQMDARPAPVPLGKGLTSWVIREGRPLRLGPDDFERLTETGEIELLGSPAFSWLGVPLISNGATVGALVVQSYNPTAVLDAEHERILSAVAVHMANVIERQRGSESLVKLERAVQAAGDAIFMTDPAGIFTFVNPEFTRLYGWEPEEVIGKVTPRILKSGRMTEQMYEQFWAQLVGGHVVRGEIVNRTRDGRLLVVEGSANPVLDEHGHISGYLGSQRDITQRRTLEQRLEKLNECFLSFSPDPVANINRLTALCGELLEAECALYNCLEGDLLRAIGQWNAPADFSPVDQAAGHICLDVINEAASGLHVVRDLPRTSYFESDPNVARYGLQTYVGMPVKCGPNWVGSLCVLYRRDYEPTEDVAKLMGIVAAAIGVEELRRRAQSGS